jgi:dsDNA-specific endonuclease/ATPase MutS2
MADFEIGDEVAAIDDIINGTVKAMNGTQITVLCSDGFVMEFEAHELVKMESDITVTPYEVAKIKKEKEVPKPKRARATKPKERNLPKMEVDLHIHQLVPNTKNMGNYEMLNVQLETAKRQLEFAMEKKIQKVVFIHGVGEGVLKEELQYLFRKYDNVDYYDADYQKYGLGATEVYIYQNR